MMNMTQFELPMTSSPLYSGGGGQDYQTEDGDKEFERGASRKAAKNVTPVDVRTLQRHECDQPLVLCGQEVGMVSLVGQVRQVSQGMLSYTYLIEDETGRIEAIQYVEDDASLQLPVQNTFVQIIGVLKSGRERNMVTVFKVMPIRDMNQVTAHKLELIAMPLRMARQQARAAVAAQATFQAFQSQALKSFGAPGSGYFPGGAAAPGRGGDGGMASRGANHHHMNNNNPLLPGPGILKQPSMCVRPGQLSHPQRQSTIDQFLGSNSGTSNIPAAAGRVLASIKQCPVTIGLSRRDLLSTFRSLGEQRLGEALHYLTSEGHIYNTVDEFHYKATDA